MNGDRTEIFISKKKSIKHILAAACLTAMSILVLAISEEQNTLPPEMAELVGYLSLAIFIPLLLYFVYRLSDDSPAIILDAAGLTDNSSATSAGFIPWDQIEELQVKTMHSTPILGIVLRDSEFFFKSANPVARFLYKINRKVYRTSCMISTTALKIDFEEFEELVRSYQHKYSG